MTVLDPIPDRWTRCPLGDIVEIIRGVTYEKAEARDAPAPGLVPILRANNIGEKLEFNDLVYVPESRISDEQRLRVGDIVVAASSGSRSVVGKAAPLLAPWRGAFGAFCMVVRPSPRVNPRYVAYFMATREYRTRVSLLAAGVNINNLKRQHVAETPIPLAALIEQNRIVAEIEKQFTRLDAGVAALEQLQAHLRRYRAAVLKDGFEGRLAHSVAASGPEGGAALAADLKSRRLKSILPDPLLLLVNVPSTWGRAALGSVAATTSGGTPNRSHPEYYGGPIPWVKSGELRDGVVLASREGITQLALDSSNAKVFPKGTLCVALYGATIGKLGVLGVDAATNQAVCGVFLPPELDTQFVFRFLESSRARLIERGKGGAQPNISQEIVRGLEIPVPTPEEQKQIVKALEAQLSQVSALDSCVEAGLARSRRLRAAILRAAFDGRLVDPEQPARAPAA